MREDREPRAGMSLGRLRVWTLGFLLLKQEELLAGLIKLIRSNPD